MVNVVNAVQSTHLPSQKSVRHLLNAFTESNHGSFQYYSEPYHVKFT